MKIVIFEDMERSRNLIRDTIQGCIDKNYLDFEIYMVTGDANSLRRTIDELNETAVYFIDIMIDGNPVGLEIVDLISGRNKSDFIIITTAYPEKILFSTEYKLKATSVILKNFKQFKPLYVTQNRLYEEISMTLVYISDMLRKASDNGYLIVKNVFKSMLRLSFYNIIFIETYPRNRLKINYDNGEFIFRGTLKAIKKQLDGRFMQCHQSYIVNKQRIKEISVCEREIIFDNGQCCYFSDHYKEKVMESLND